MPDFWKSADAHLTERTENGWLAVTDDYLRAYYTRPELHPVEGFCAGEHTLFEKLMAAPRVEVDASEIEAIIDEDAADSYRFMWKGPMRRFSRARLRPCRP
ncbi:DUF6352 family protein [Breoghania sp.]|uniref:DUF6352 family protein n=1 Tax=Breoghania sp. TaxID=2065378 RepID=UPI002609C0A2|nr:DUF6352 family protein [Breoghania sp.]MDJ0931415.1 DUF6352 family protein [Breoghania sp.]